MSLHSAAGPPRKGAHPVPAIIPKSTSLGEETTSSSRHLAASLSITKFIRSARGSIADFWVTVCLPVCKVLDSRLGAFPLFFRIKIKSATCFAPEHTLYDSFA